jgi:hypothetical protein
MMLIQVNGAPTYCYTGGKPFDAAKPTVVFIHGVLNDHSVWILQSATSPTTASTCSRWTCRATAERRRGALVRRGGGRLHRRAARCGRRTAGDAGRPQLGLAHCAGSRRAPQRARHAPGAGGHGVSDEGVARADRGLAERPDEGADHGQRVFTQHAVCAALGAGPGHLGLRRKLGTGPARAGQQPGGEPVPPRLRGLRPLRQRRGGHHPDHLPGAFPARRRGPDDPAQGRARPDQQGKRKRARR